MSTIYHTILLTDGAPLSSGIGTSDSGIVVDLTSKSGDANRYGYGIILHTLDWGDPAAQVITETQSFARDGEAPLAERFGNRVVKFTVTVKGSSQSDVHTRFGVLQRIAQRARDYSFHRKGYRPKLKWRSNLTGRSYYLPIYWMFIAKQRTYGGPETLSNQITADVTIVAPPDMEEYTRPIFYAVSPTAADLLGNRLDGAAVTGYAIGNDAGDYLRNDWVDRAFAPGGAAGWVTMWFRAEWNTNDPQTRGLFSLGDGTTNSVICWRDTSNNFNLQMTDNSAATRTLQLPAATVAPYWSNGAWYGIHFHWSAASPGFRAYLMTDGLTGYPNQQVLEFSAGASTVVGSGYYITATPKNLTVGAYQNGATRITGIAAGSAIQVDSVEIGDYVGFQAPSNTDLLAFTRDPGSIIVQYPHLVAQQINAESGSFSAEFGHLQTFIRRYQADRPGKLDVRLRSVTGGVNPTTIRAWVTEQAYDKAQTGYPYLVVNTVGASYGATWGAGALASAWDGSHVAAAPGATLTAASNAAWSKVVSIDTDQLARMLPGTYLACMRVYTDNAANTDVRLLVSNGAAAVDSGVRSYTPAVNGWNIVPMMLCPVPPNADRDGGFQFAVTTYATQTVGTNVYLDSVLFIPIREEADPALVNLTTALDQATQELQLLADKPPYLFRVTQSNNLDAAPSYAFTGTDLRLYPLSDNRLWIVFEESGGGNVKGRQMQVDLWVTPTALQVR